MAWTPVIHANNANQTLVAATGSPGTEVYSIPDTETHELELVVWNFGTSTIKVTAQMGGTADKDGVTKYLTAGAGPIVIMAGRYKASGAALSFKMFASLTNKIACHPVAQKI